MLLTVLTRIVGLVHGILLGDSLKVSCEFPSNQKRNKSQKTKKWDDPPKKLSIYFDKEAPPLAAPKNIPLRRNEKTQRARLVLWICVAKIGLD